MFNSSRIYRDLSQIFSEELSHVETRFTLPFNRVAMPFVQKSPNLRKLILSCPHRYQDDYIDSIVLNGLRIPLKNARHMTIGIEVSDKTKQSPRIYKTDRTLVTVKKAIRGYIYQTISENHCMFRIFFD